MSECYIVRPTWWEMFKNGSAYDLDRLNYAHQLYLPHQFYLGQFKEYHGYYKLSSEIIYRDLPEDLQRYELLLAQRKLTIVKDTIIPDDDLAVLVEKAKTYLAMGLQIREITASWESKGLLATP